MEVIKEEFLENCKKFMSPNDKIEKVERDGYTYYRSGKSNIDRWAKLLMKHIKF